MPVFKETMTSGRGGFRKPLQVSVFILDWLAKVGEDNISSMKKNYYEALTEAGRLGGRFEYEPNTDTWKGKPYRKPTYHSFKIAVENQIRLGLVEIARTEVSDDPRFANWPEKPLRNYYRLTGSKAKPKPPKKPAPPPKPVKPPEEVSINRPGNPRDNKPLKGKNALGELPLQGRRTRK